MTLDEFLTALKETGQTWHVTPTSQPGLCPTYAAIRTEADLRYGDRRITSLCPLEAVYVHRTGQYANYTVAAVALGLSVQEGAAIAHAADVASPCDCTFGRTYYDLRERLLNVLNLG